MDWRKIIHKEIYYKPTASIKFKEFVGEVVYDTVSETDRTI